MGLAVSTVLYDGYSFDMALSELSQAGVTAIEPAFIKGYVDFTEADFSGNSASRLARRVAVEGLSVQAVSAHIDMGDPDAVDMLKRRIDFAARVGGKYLITNSTTKDRADAFTKTLEEIGRHCEASGVMLALENPGHGTNNIIGTLADGHALMERIGGGWIGLNYDVGNLFTYSRGMYDPMDDLCRDLRHIVHAHLKDISTIGEDWAFTAIGDGVINYDAILPCLLKTQVPMTLELPIRLRRPKKADPLRASTPSTLVEIRKTLTASLTYCRDHGVV